MHTTFDIYLKWPCVVADVNLMNKFWFEVIGDVKIEPYQSFVVEFRNFFFFDGTGETDRTMTTSRLRLP